LTVIYAKTQKGLTEMESRSGEIGPRVRRLLIFVDGKRSVDQLKAMVGEASLEESLELLQSGGFIEVVESAAGSGALAAVVPTVTATVAGDGQELDERHLDMARKLMVNSLRDFTGPMKYRALMQKVADGATAADLGALVDEWYEAVNDNPAASFAVDDIRSNIVAALEGRG